jgi:hypothetical protein
MKESLSLARMPTLSDVILKISLMSLTTFMVNPAWYTQYLILHHISSAAAMSMREHDIIIIDNICQ